MRWMTKLFKKLYYTFLRSRWQLSPVSARLLGESYLKDYREKRLPAHKILSIHRKGFVVSDWSIMGVTAENYKAYLSDAQYCRMHPLNGKFTQWIDDKLTLKYLCSGTELDRYMPEYYYQIDEKGRVICLMDAPVYKQDAAGEDIAALLKEKGVLAIKQIAGSIGKGFYKSEYKDGVCLLNGEPMDECEFCKRMSALRNYIVIEYLRPHKELAEYCPDTVNCIRYLLGRVNGRLEMVKGFIRFGTKKSSFVENYNVGGVLCFLDENGCYHNGNIIHDSGLENCVVQNHPDSGKVLEGRIPLWDEVVKAGEAFDRRFPQLKYLGMDFVITSDDRVKILEINSLTSLDTIQLDVPVFQSKAGVFFQNMINS